MDWIDVILIVLVVVFGLIVLRFAWTVLSLAIPLFLAAVVFLFVADKFTRQPGEQSPIDQLASRIANWLRTRR